MNQNHPEMAERARRRRIEVKCLELEEVLEGKG